VIPINVATLLARQKAASSFASVTGVTSVTDALTPSNHAGVRPLAVVTPPQSPRCDRCDTQESQQDPSTPVTPHKEHGEVLMPEKVADACPHQEHVSPLPPSYPGRPVGAPFRPGQRVWLYRWDNHTPRFNAPVTIVQMRLVWPGEPDIGWCDAAGALSWHNARLAVAVEIRKVLSQSQKAI
jgi:hypothetical protein